jgi:hypothetical protein
MNAFNLMKLSSHVGIEPDVQTHCVDLDVRVWWQAATADNNKTFILNLESLMQL